MPSQSQSQMNEDAELIDELRRYGEKNLPLLQPIGSNPNAKRKSSGPNYLNDLNRDIYLKKLNHYRAREKIETNPSKEYLKQHLQLDDGRKSLARSSSNPRRSNTYALKSQNNDDDDDDDDVVEITDEINKSEYVQGNNAHTSPLSMSSYYDDEYVASNIISSTQAPLTSTVAKPITTSVRSPEDLSKEEIN